MRVRTLRDADRGLAFRLVVFGLMWVIGGMLFALLDPLMGDMFTQFGAYTSTSQASTGKGYVEQFWQFAPFIIALLGILQILAGAIIERRAGVRV
jgi:hypothetical protein